MLGGEKPNLGDRYQYSWSVLNNIIKNFLNNTELNENKDSIFNCMKLLQDKLKKVKKKQDICEAELYKLKMVQDIEAEDPINSRFNQNLISQQLNEKTWQARQILDGSHLEERTLTCESILSKVEEKLK